MKVIGILGGPHRGGHTEKLLDEALAAAAAAGAGTERLDVARLDVAPCLACGGCAEAGDCVIEDDMTGLYEKLLTADAVIISSPIFFYGLPSQLKALIDRSQALWERKYNLGRVPPVGKRALFMASSGGRGQKVFDGALLSLKYFLDTLGIEQFETVLFRGADLGDGRDGFSDALAEAATKARRLVLGEAD